ncbi:MAG: hypothetical protein [Bacteriophage sp.]|nr:MAG: hypothetical protein [Bacteriophage sp.]
MKRKEFAEFALNLLSERKGRANALTPGQINDELYRRSKRAVEPSTASQMMIILRKEKLVKRHQPGHSKSTFYYWID